MGLSGNRACHRRRALGRLRGPRRRKATTSMKVLALDRQNFEAWYAAILEKLYPIRDAGFIIATITFPLLERYVRQKIQLPADQPLNARFDVELTKLIPG